MRSIRSLLWAVAAASSLFAGAAAAQVTHRAYLDLDSNAATGCSVATPAGNVTGIEARLTATVSGQPPMVTAVTRENCLGAAFGAPQAQAAGYPVGVNIGTGGADVVEFATSLTGLGSGGPANITFVSSTATGADIVVANGVVLPGQVAAPTQPAIIPATGLLTLLLLAGLVVFIVRRHPGFGSSVALLLLLGAGVVWAANFVTDGAIGDWSGVQPRAVDANNDATSGEMTIEIVAVFAEAEGGNLFLRVDVRDAQNQPPVANTPVAATFNEDGSTTFTLTGSDPEGAALTFAIATNPTRGTLGPIVTVNATTATVLYTASANQNGADSFTFTVNDGSSSSTPATASITITPVNDAPTVTAATFNVVENSPNGTNVGTPVAGSDVDTGQVLTWSITAGNTGGAFTINAATGQITVANSAAVVGTSFALTVQATDNSGAANNTGSATITVNVTGVNDEPSFTAGPNQSGTEDDPAVSTPWATAISAGPADEAGQTLTFTVSNDNNALFSVQPAIAANGTLTYTLAPNANGTATVSVFLRDNGGTAGGGDDTSPTVTFTITVAAVNDTPSFVVGPTQDVLQDSTPAPVANFATGITAGPADESGQALAFNVSNDNNALFSVQPSIAPNGTLSYTPAAGQIGTATVSVTLSDNGVPVATSAVQTFVINVSDVNDAPSFTVPAAAPAVNEDAGAQLLAGFATALNDNDPTVQTLTFTIVVNSNPALFSAGPTLTVNGAVGDLAYTPAANQSGSATITVRLSDSGGTANGGVDTSATQDFTITVNAVNDAPTFSSPAAFSVPEDTTPVGTVAATDVEGSAIVYSITGGADAALFGINSSTGALSFLAPRDFELPGDVGGNNVYDVIVTASDGADNPTQAIAVTVTNVNEAPVITSGNTVNVPENTTAVTTVTSTDGDGDTVTYAIVGGPDAARFMLNTSTGVLAFIAPPNFEAPNDADANNTYVVALTATDGTLTAAQTLTVTVTAVDEAPLFSSPAAFNVVEDTTAVGTAVATDPEGNAVGYSLTGTDAAFFSINPSTGVIAFLVAPDFEMPADAGGDNVYDIVVNANDGAQTGTQNVAVTVTNTNGAPTITSSATPSVPENQVVVTTVTATDPDGDTLTFAISGGVDALLFSINASTGALTFLAPPNFEAPSDAGTDNVYNVTVTASDGTATPAQALVITVTDVNEAPVFTSPTGFSVPEDTLPVGNVVAIDPEATAVTYSLTGGADMAFFTINGATGALSFLTPRNFEAPADAGLDNVYDVIVTASDGSNSPTQNIAVTVTNTNDAPVFTSSATPSAPENQTTAVLLTATDGDGNTLTFSITGGVDAARFSIVGSTLTFVSPPDYEAPTDAGADNVYNVDVAVNDGTVSTPQSIAVSVTNVNEAPTITTGAAFNVPENSTAVTTVAATDPDGAVPTYSITGGADQGDFSIDTNTGALSFVVAPDFELPADSDTNNVYLVQVTATDGVNNTNQTITVTVTNVNEGPSFTSANAGSVPENTAGTAFTATASDTEGDPITFSISGGADAGDLAITPAGAISFLVAPNFEAPADSDTNNTYVVQLTATSTGGSANQTLTLTVTNVNEAPVITSGVPASVPENTATAFHTVTATDPDATVPTFAISGGADAADFSINAATGALSFAVAPNFEAPADADANNVYQVTVRATDGALFDDETYSITVTDVNEAPVIVADAAYNYIANTELRIAGHAGVPTALAFTTSAINPKANDTDPDTNPAFNTLTYVPQTNAASVNNGTVDVAADGTIRYTPPAGFTGTDTVNYQLTDGANPVAGSLTFTVTGTDVVWYVQNNDATPDATATRDGTSSYPFNTLLGAQTASADNHIIYVDNGDNTVTGQNAGIALKNGQDLIGNGVALVVNGATTLIAAGTQPQIGNTGGAGVSAPNRSGTVVIRGLNIAGSTDAVLATCAGATVCSLEVGDNTIRSAGNEGIDIEMSGTGSMSASVHDNVVTAGAAALELTETAAGPLTIIAFDDNVVTGDSNSHGIIVTNATFDASPATAAFTTVAGGSTTVGASGNRVTNAGIQLTNVLGDLSFSNLDIFNNNGPGLSVSSAGAFNAAGTGFRLVGGVATDVIETNGGPGIDISSATIDFNPVDVDVTGSSTFGINLSGVAGTFTAGAGSSIGTPTAAAGTAYRVNNSSVNASFAGTITATQGSGVSLTANTGSYSFGGALSLSTGTSPAFVATNSGVVTATNAANALTTTSATALTVTGTTIGATNLVFRSITAGTAGISTSNGVVLANTGALGGLKVNGTGAAGTGGTIQNVVGANGATAGNGFHFTNTQQVSLNWMSVMNSQNNGLFGTGVRHLSMNEMRFTGNHGTENNGATTESAVQLNDLGGTVSFTNSTFNGGFANGVRVNNSIGTAPALTLTANNIAITGMQGSLADVGGTAFLVTAFDGSANVSVTNSNFTVWWGNAVHVLLQQTATGRATITNNTANNTNGALAGAGGIWVAGCSMIFDIVDNAVSRTNGTAIAADKTNCPGGTFQGRIHSNDIGISGVVDSGSGTGIGIFVAGRNGTTTVRVTDNVLRQINGSASGAITTVVGDDVVFAPAGTLNATISGNNIQESGSVVNNAQHGILMTHGTTSSGGGDPHVGCYDILSNTIINFVSGTANNRIRINQRFTGVSRFPGYVGPNNDPVALGNYFLSRNTASTSTNTNNVASGGQGYTNTIPAGSACPQPAL